MKSLKRAVCLWSLSFGRCIFLFKILIVAVFTFDSWHKESWDIIDLVRGASIEWYRNRPIIFKAGCSRFCIIVDPKNIHTYGGLRHKKAEIAICVTFLLECFLSSFLNAISDHQTKRNFRKRSKNIWHALS